MYHRHTHELRTFFQSSAATAHWHKVTKLEINKIQKYNNNEMQKQRTKIMEVGCSINARRLTAKACSASERTAAYHADALLLLQMMVANLYIE